MNEKFDLPLDKENKEQLKKKILVAEDSHSLRAGLESILAMAGYAVTTVSDGKELLEVHQSGEKFDLLITDNNMPHMDGIEAIEELRKDPRFDSLPILLHSAEGNINFQLRVKAAGARYLQKPYGLDILENIVKEMLDEAAP